MAGKKVIELTAGRSCVAVRDIPGLIAHALWPTIDQEPILRDMQKRTEKDKRPQPLTLADHELLKGIWGKLGPLPPGTPRSQWLKHGLRFIAAEFESGSQLNWSLVPIWDDPAADRHASRISEQKKQQERLTNAIKSGKVLTRNTQLTELRNKAALAPNALVTVTDLKKYVAKLGIEVRTDASPYKYVPPTPALGSREWLQQRAIHAANAKHSKPDGSRDKAAKVRAIWASGKYTSRDRCAEEECAGLGMSFSAARKALRNTRDQTRT